MEVCHLGVHVVNERDGVQRAHRAGRVVPPRLVLGVDLAGLPRLGAFPLRLGSFLGFLNTLGVGDVAHRVVEVAIGDNTGTCT